MWHKLLIALNIVNLKSLFLMVLLGHEYTLQLSHLLLKWITNATASSPPPFMWHTHNSLNLWIV